LWRKSASRSSAEARTAKAAGTQPKLVGETSRRFSTVASNCPGSGRPESMYSVPAMAMMPLKTALPPKVWCQGSQSTNV
jgi:hypothetical protein